MLGDRPTAAGEAPDGAGPGRGRPVWALGLMSGTALDGVDAALLLTDGERIEAFGPSGFLPYADGDCAALAQVMADPHHFRGRLAPGEAGVLAEAEREVVRLHARAVVDLLAEAAEAPAVVAFPGQTAAHAPEHRWTWQLGDGRRLATALNRPVVWDFRSDDIRAGGQGAPLAPFYHFALAKRAGTGAGGEGSAALPEGPLAFLNIGGVGNVTWVDPAAAVPEAEGALVAFDTGPGNALVNDWMARHTGEALDRDGTAALAALQGEAGAGAWSAAGRALMAEARSALGTNFVADFLDRAPPKSLDRNEFATLLGRLEGWGTAPGAAALTLFTADCARAAERHLPRPPVAWLVCGGGRRNPALMALLSEGLGAPVMPVEALGLDGDMTEAQAFAFLAVRVMRGLPTSAPGTTGCAEPVCGGRLSRPA